MNKDGEFEDYTPCLSEKFMREVEVELAWQAQAGGSLEATVEESSGMTAVTSAIHHEAGGEYWDHRGDNGRDAGYHAG